MRLLRPPVVYQPPPVTLFGQQALVAYLEGRPSIDPTDPLYRLQRRAIEETTFARQRQSQRAEREVRRLLATGEVSKWQLVRELQAQ